MSSDNFNFLGFSLSSKSISAAAWKKIKEAVNELKEFDTQLNQIRQTSNLTNAQLKSLADTAYDTAGKYGKSASAYLSAIQEMSLAGYKNTEALAELSLLLQTISGLSSEAAKEYLLAADAAYQLQGNISGLNEVLDGQSSVASKNALSMAELAKATRLTASLSADAGISMQETTAALSTMMAATSQSGESAAHAWESILTQMQQAKGTLSGSSSLDTSGLSAFESACASLGVSLTELKHGALELRDPISILEELSAAYNSLSSSDSRRTDLLSSLGDASAAKQFGALLSNWNQYETMLSDYSNSTGSAMALASQYADHWESSFTRLSNTWTETVGNIVNSDGVAAGINALNGLLGVINQITEAAGPLGSIGLLSGLTAGFKNAGRVKCYPSNRICLP